MIIKTRRRAAAVGATVLVLSLAACGDDDVPASAGQLAPVTAAGDTGAATSPTPVPSTPTSAGPATVVDARAELEVEDQSGDGSGVRVEEVRLSIGDGHLAILTLDRQLLGSARVTAGSQPVTIPLDPAVMSSGELLAVLHGDDGDGVFEVDADPVVVDEDGESETEGFDYQVS